MNDVIVRWRFSLMRDELLRRELVMAGQPDPHSGEPWRVCSAEDMIAWRQAHPAPLRAFHAARDTYGVTGL